MIQYCTKIPRHCGDGTYFNSIYPSVMQVRMCIENSEPVYEIDVTEDIEPTETSYWGWLDHDGSISMIHPVFFIMDMCFPDGSAAEEKAGRGKVIRVKIKEIRKVVI